MTATAAAHGFRPQSTSSASSYEEGELPRSQQVAAAGPIDIMSVRTTDNPDQRALYPGAPSTTTASQSPCTWLQAQETHETVSPGSNSTPMKRSASAEDHFAESAPSSPLTSTSSPVSSPQNKGAATRPGALEDHSTIRECHEPQSDESYHDLSSSPGSDTPLRAHRSVRRPRIISSPSPSPSDDTQTAKEPLPGRAGRRPAESAPGTTTSLIKTEKRQPNTTSSASPLSGKRPGEEEKWLVDIDWGEKCDRCEELGLRCFNKVGSVTRTKSCSNCRYIKRRPCTVNGVRVNTPREKVVGARSKDTKSKRTKSTGTGSAKKMSARPGRAAKERQRPSTPPGCTRRENGQYVRAAVQSTEASALTGTQTRSRKRRATEPGVQSAAARVAATSQQSSATMSSTPRGTRRTRHSAVEQVHTRTDLDQDPAADTSTNLSIPNEQDHTEVEVATTTAAPTPHFEKYTMGLINDIETSIRRCQERIIAMPPLSGLLALHGTVEVLVEDLGNVLKPDNSALDGAKTAHWILPQLKDYLQRILLACQRADERVAGQQRDEDERSARQDNAKLKCQALFDRCLTLISMNAG